MTLLFSKDSQKAYAQEQYCDLSHDLFKKNLDIEEELDELEVLKSIPWESLPRDQWKGVFWESWNQLLEKGETDLFYRIFNNYPIDLLEVEIRRLERSLERSLFDFENREISQHLLRAGLIRVSSLNVRKYIPESWHEIPSFQEALKVSRERAIRNFLDEANFVDEMVFLEHLNDALIIGRLDLAEEIFEHYERVCGLSWRLSWSEVAHSASFGELESLDWLAQRLGEPNEEDCELLIAGVLKREESPASLKRLELLLEKPYISMQIPPYSLIRNAVWLKQGEFLKRLISWEKFQESDWETYMRQLQWPLSFFQNMYALRDPEFFQAMLESIPDRFLERLFCTAIFFGDLEIPLARLFIARYWGCSEDEVPTWEKGDFHWALIVSNVLYAKNVGPISQVDAVEDYFIHFSQLEPYWQTSTKSFCSLLMKEKQDDNLLAHIFEKLDLEPLRHLAKSEHVQRVIKELNLKDCFAVFLRRNALDLEDYLFEIPPSWRSADFFDALHVNAAEKISHPKDRVEAYQCLKMALHRGRLDLADKILSRFGREALFINTMDLEKVVGYQRYESVEWVFQRGLFRPTSEEMRIFGQRPLDRTMRQSQESLIDSSVKSNWNELLNLFLEARLGMGGDISTALKKAVEMEDLPTAKLLIDCGALHLPHYGQKPNETLPLYFDIFEMADEDFLRHIFRLAPETFYYALFLDEKRTLAVGHERALKIAIEERIGMDPERIFEMLKEQKPLVALSFYRALFLSHADMQKAEKLMHLFEELKGSSDEVLHEFYFHLFTKFRPDFLEGETGLEPLLSCWRQTHSDEERALFFNALQAGHSLETVESALKGYRFFHYLDEMSCEEDILNRLAYVEVATYHQGKSYALEIYLKRSDNQRMQLQALKALSSLAVPLPDEAIEEMKCQFHEVGTSFEIKKELLHLFFSMRRNPNDSYVKECVIANPKLGLDLIKHLNFKEEELSQLVPPLLILSRSKDRALRVRSAFALAALHDESALLRAAEIIQSSDWEGYDDLYRHEELGHYGHWLLFLRRPDFHDNRSLMMQHICTRLAALKKDEIQENVLVRMQSYEENPEAFPLLEQLKTLVAEHKISTRYIPVPIFYPKGSLFRGLRGRKGDALFYESMRDLMRHGSYRADLSHFETFLNGTWCKIGHIFGTHSMAMVSDYNASKRDEIGVTMMIDSSYYNEEYLKGTGRLEREMGTLNNVFYHGIPLVAIQKIYFPKTLERAMRALYEGKPLPQSKLFEGYSPEQLDELRFYLHQTLPDGSEVMDRFFFGEEIAEKEISVERIAQKSVKRHVQRDEVKKLYGSQMLLQDEILEDLTDAEFAHETKRIIALLNPSSEHEEALCGLKTDEIPCITMTPLRMRKIARLAILFKSGDRTLLRKKQALHRASLGDIALIEGLLDGKSYHQLLNEVGYPICAKSEYENLLFI